jgi:hypothetical protein
VLTLLVIPTVYEILDQFRAWVTARFRPAAAHPEPAAAPAD